MKIKFISIIFLLIFLSKYVKTQYISNNIQIDLRTQFVMLVNKTESAKNFNLPILSLLIFSLFGTFGNGLVCFTIWRDQKLHTKTNYYLFSLAIADLAVCAIVIPLAIVQDFYGKFCFHF